MASDHVHVVSSFLNTVDVLLVLLMTLLYNLLQDGVAVVLDSVLVSICAFLMGRSNYFDALDIWLEEGVFDVSWRDEVLA